MIFLIVYNRQKGRTVTLERFKNSERIKAENKRLKIELKLNRKKGDDEVVLLEARNENVLKHTHQRYFSTLDKMVNSTMSLNNSN